MSAPGARSRSRPRLRPPAQSAHAESRTENGRGPLCRRSSSKFSCGNGTTQSRSRWSPISALSEIRRLPLRRARLTEQRQRAEQCGGIEVDNRRRVEEGEIHRISARRRMAELEHHVGAALDGLVEEDPLGIVLGVLADRSGGDHLLGGGPLAADVDGGGRHRERLHRLVASAQVDDQRHDRLRVARLLHRCFLAHRVPAVGEIVQQRLAVPLQAVGSLSPLDHAAADERVLEAREQVGRQRLAVELELGVVAVGEAQPIRPTARAGNVVGALEVAGVVHVHPRRGHPVHERLEAAELRPAADLDDPDVLAVDVPVLVGEQVGRVLPDPVVAVLRRSAPRAGGRKGPTPWSATPAACWRRRRRSPPPARRSNPQAPGERPSRTARTPSGRCGRCRAARSSRRRTPRYAVRRPGRTRTSGTTHASPSRPGSPGCRGTPRA